jgi:outer membrane lipoprotein carrier protein
MSLAWVRRYGGFALAAALLSVCLSAQERPPTAKDLAQRVNRHYDNLRSLRANFQESYEGLGINRAESGTLLLEKPGRMRWEYSAPPGKVFLIDGKYAWFYTPGDPQVQRIAAKELDDLRSPLRFLLGHTDLEKELTGLQLAAGPNGNGKPVLMGVPKGQEKRVTRITLAVEPATGALVAIEIDEVDGAVTRFTFSDQQPDVPVPAATFRFTPPKGVPVVDGLPPV